ncbi:MAG: plasmid mobilization relaxosome protein MobC [Ruminiclostridium sp.]|nr:plasmid mobilization relaxosome protein MobC [Ruminiclostridium sp.]
MKRTNRARRKEVTFTSEEWEKVVKRASSASLKPATFIKRAAINCTITVNNYPELSTLLNGLRIIGNNINQLAKKANEINCIYADDYEKMKGEYEALCLTLNQFVSTLR